ncbi:hypothetical protein SAMD00019534_091840 [Acytostelium subglobosum LB1]|uniref:hypothetical protein n=1 Tax=Acytostelium subglobosum LB1 TaxID=1410327 RepID=UPI000644EA2F|nr:hypothetical protein SAMD00019534_091840 [Acytostelium subglobosum LB1]GAM26009.1 hypothetical protein SAMD00019534_091840 [Acytostelium subglobosum LB1]|eukprot:XP_012751052.1 hypothetical protein SAMD00019534_091840 [Acytostelium subglobosum LB1]
MNRIGKLLRSAVLPSSSVVNHTVSCTKTIAATPSRAFMSWNGMEFLQSHANLSAAAMVHQQCFDTPRNVEQMLIDEVGDGQGDPALNPSPS